MENKLIPMTDFVLEQSNNFDGFIECFERCERYASFLKQPLALWMFIPVDENNVLLEEPVAPKNFWESDEQDAQLWAQHQYDSDKYNEAKERVLFEGFHIVDFEEHQVETLKHTYFLQWDDIEIASKKEWEDNWDFEYPTIESLSLNNNLEITLTATAIKSIYGS